MTTNANGDAIYHGRVTHQRYTPVKHRFSYQLYLFWLDLRQLETAPAHPLQEQQHTYRGVYFKRSDYLDQAHIPLHQRALQRMSELARRNLTGEVFLLGQVRMLNVYFSPVNFYYLRQPDGHFSHLLAEVSNTPWDNRHHYLVDLSDREKITPKALHVSPFNPMDMQYHWRISQPQQHLSLAIECIKQHKHFEAAINMRRHSLTETSLAHAIRAIPSTTIKTMAGIYWQALKLAFKRAPFYGYPRQTKADKVNH